MYHLTPYLFFAGRCEEALDFYCHCFEGVVLTKQYFKHAPQRIEGADPEWIMHAELEAFGMKLMLSDGLVAKERSGNHMALSLVMDDLNQQARVFDKLSHGGRIMTMLEDTFWGARFGKVEDQFGIRWMLHCELVQQ
ncbi:VOC family protein [Vibrio ostreicida]|uniref:VOC family protein n=1 Tax=Vibrio ostreicida TaxID=526588 RepID=A0ABT8BM61_9VIBR|nr:VOC family protein [Vibrio ostreicida]MDN3608216.1 VOC family protein [Vibrio ostreicida]NPD09797.1 VOC family protein [Vibrio ostreicida]